MNIKANIVLVLKKYEIIKRHKIIYIYIYIFFFFFLTQIRPYFLSGRVPAGQAEIVVSN